MFRKELRDLLTPVTLQLVFFGVAPWAYALLTEIPDQMSLTDLYDDGIDLTVFVFLVSFVIGLAQLVREHDQATIRFLDTLPTTRTRVFFAKFIAGCVAFSATPIAWLCASVPLAYWSRDSLDDSVHLDFALVTAALVYATAIVGYTYGLALSSLRRFAWLVVAVVMTIIVRFRTDAPWLTLFQPSEILELRLHGDDRVIPWRALAVQGAVSALGVVVGWASFAGWSDRLAHEFSMLNSSRRGRLALGCSVVLVVLAFMVMSAVWAASEPPERPVKQEIEGVSFAPARPQTIGTRAFSFRVAGQLDPEARARIDDADRIHDLVRAWFGAAAVPPISVDASANLGYRAHLGQTQWQAISISAWVLDDEEDFDVVIAHETAHVYANVVSDRRLADHHSTTRLFHEGLATVVAEDVTGKARGTLAAAFVRQRKLITTDMIFDDTALNARVDPALAYGLGVELVRATMDLGDKDTPVRILKAMARPDVPKDLRGLTLMRDAYQTAGVDLDRVIERFYARLDAAVAQHAAVLETIPFTQAGVEVEDNLVRIQLVTEQPVSFEGRCQVRARPDAPPNELIQLRAMDGVCSISRRSVPLATAEIQVGWIVDGELVLEAWNEVRLE